MPLFWGSCGKHFIICASHIAFVRRVLGRRGCDYEWVSHVPCTAPWTCVTVTDALEPLATHHWKTNTTISPGSGTVFLLCMKHTVSISLFKNILIKEWVNEKLCISLSIHLHSYTFSPQGGGVTHVPKITASLMPQKWDWKTSENGQIPLILKWMDMLSLWWWCRNLEARQQPCYASVQLRECAAVP